MADFQVNERLEYLIRNVFRTNPTAFSKAYNDTGGVKTSQVIRKRNGLSSKMLDIICNAYPSINRNWLLTGQGEPLIETEEDAQENDSGNTTKVTEVSMKVLEKLVDANESLATSNRILAENYAKLIERLNIEVKK